MSELKGIEVHDVFGLSQPITKLIETFRSAIGTWYAPIGVRRLAKAKAFELQTVSEALNSNLNLPSEYSDGKITISTQNFEELAKRTGNRLFYQEMKKQQNIEAIVEIAGAELEKEESVSNEPVDQDWTIRFFNSVEDVSNEDMQKIWGRVLAGEVKQPKSFSIRTLEKLKNISRTEALLFENLLSYCFFSNNEVLLANEDDLHAKYGIVFLNKLILEDCGLIQSVSGLSFEIMFNNTEFSQSLTNKNYIGILKLKDGANIKVTIPVIRLTETGRELHRVTNITPNNEFFIDFLKKLRDKNNKISVSAHKIVEISDINVTYSNIDELPPNEIQSEGDKQ